MLLFIGVSTNLKEKTDNDRVNKIAIITEKFSTPSLFNSLIIIMPIALCNKYHEKDIRPILDNKSNLNLMLFFKIKDVNKIIQMKYIS